MAASMESFSSVFTKSPVPTVLTSGSEKTPYQQAFSEDAFQSASVKGVGSSMKRLADYYMDMAENIFPVIEIDAGRQVDFIMTRGTTLKLH
jgi:conjugal transfer pilus assembly protein TraB